MLSSKIGNSYTQYLIFAQCFQTYLSCQYQPFRRRETNSGTNSYISPNTVQCDVTQSEGGALA